MSLNPTRLLMAACLIGLLGNLGRTQAAAQTSGSGASPAQGSGTMMKRHPYLGMWITGDGHVRQALLPDGRYDEARGARRSAYQGRYEVTGTRIEYWDDTGFTADGVFVGENELHHGGMTFHRAR